MRHLAAAGNTLVPAILALEELGFTVEDASVGDLALMYATRGDERFAAADPIALLGLVKLVEVRSWNWRAEDDEIQRAMGDPRYGL